MVRTVIYLWALLNESCPKQNSVINEQLKLVCHLFVMHKWKLLLFIHLAYDMLITSYAFKTTVANGQSLVFSLKNNSPLEKRHADHHFCVQMFEFQQFRTSGESKALSARRSWVIVMCSVGETFYSPSISPRSWNNWLFILEYSLVLAGIY